MNRTSLIEVSAFVVLATLAAFIVDAKEPDELNTVSLERSTEITEQFEGLLKKYDADKNGLLSKDEVAKSKQEVIMRNFKAIDTNTDASISLEELNAFKSLAKKL